MKWYAPQDVVMSVSSHNTVRSESLPLVSIGVPVYNGARYLESALECLVAQTYPHLEILISDNASTDETPAICARFQARDPRIRYYRAETNHGAPWNFNRCAELAQGRYFMWAAFDDLRHPEYVSRCVAALEADPEAVVCSTQVEFIDEQGRPTHCRLLEPGEEAIRPSGETRRERIRGMLRLPAWFDLYGLIRKSALDRITPYQEIWCGDEVMLIDLALQGRFISLPDKLFSYRMFAEKPLANVARTLVAPGQQPPPVGNSLAVVAMIRRILVARIPAGERCFLAVYLLLLSTILYGAMRKHVREELGPSFGYAWRRRRFADLAGLVVVAGALAIPRSLVVLPTRLLLTIRSSQG